MVSVLTQVGGSRPSGRAIKTSSEVNSSIGIPLVGAWKQLAVEYRRLNRVQARGYVLVTSKLVKGSKAAVIVAEDFTDDMNAIMVFHQLKVAKAFRDEFNGDLIDNIERWAMYHAAMKMFRM